MSMHVADAVARAGILGGQTLALAVGLSYPIACVVQNQELVAVIARTRFVERCCELL